MTPNDDQRHKLLHLADYAESRLPTKRAGGIDHRPLRVRLDLEPHIRDLLVQFIRGTLDTPS